MEFAAMIFQGFELPAINFPYLGTRGFVGIIMLIHMFFATAFVGYAVGSPALQYWGVRTGNPQMERLARSLARFNVLTFSVGATWAVMFLVLLLGFYPRVTAALFTHFFWFFPITAMVAMVLTLWLFYIHYYRGQKIWAGFAAAFFILVWQAILTGIDQFMTTGGGAGGQALQSGSTSISNPVSALGSIFTPTFVQMDLHRTFGNLSWPAYAVAAWAAFMYMRSKSAEDKAFYDWSTSVGLIWGTGFLLAQPLGGFLIVYSLKLAQPEDPATATAAGGAYERLTSGYTSDLLYTNLILVVGLFVLSNLAMYIGAGRHPDRAGRRPIQFFGLVAGLAGLYSISPLAEFPFLYMRYIMILVMVLATAGALLSYFRGRGRLRYGSPAVGYRMVLLALGVLAAVIALNMGFMKSNSRVPFAIYNQPSYTVENETPPTGFGK